MAVDYILKYPCEARKNIPEAKLVALVGYMSLANFAVAEIKKSNPAIANGDDPQLRSTREPNTARWNH